MSDAQISIQWLGGVWDRMSLDVDRQTALTLLGNVYRCPSHGAPFMILADIPSELGSIASYRADAEISAGDILYLRPVPSST
jgi:hypothetical protein